MSRHVQVHLIDDITGEEAQETITFGLDGNTYEIDLAEENARQLREHLSPYLDKGRKVGGRARPRAQQRPSTSNREETHRIREWAEANGYSTSSRGRISKAVLEAYQAANS
ncbi:Lsr2 family protein [Arthrobacter yangruifuii]|uniref:Lsr2 family protein n=1 Tax=Arthrobacter yangruifuii TaxID=2606616 RepID=A0A5N6MS43_9MICC|nr:Lsr2 family protein [Arthrobacter yangruifuii]KAD4059914.1 Lsr2 family protein [Arthrobacter yangruifuii]